MSSALPTDANERKGIPLVTGVLDYFPAALAEIAKVSKAGNDQHNPGEPLHWERGKSHDHVDCLGRHLEERGTRDTDGQRHTAKAAWRILAELQLECERDGAPPARGSSDNPDMAARLAEIRQATSRPERGRRIRMDDIGYCLDQPQFEQH